MNQRGLKFTRETKKYLMRLIILAMSLLTLSGCVSQASFMEVGMSKKEFIQKTEFWETNIAKIYYDPVSGVEIFAPSALWWAPNSTNIITIMENVSVEFIFSGRWYKDKCRYWPQSSCGQIGNGRVRSWYEDHEVAELAASGDEGSMLLLSVITLRQEKYEKDLATIMSGGLKWGRIAMPPGWYESNAWMPTAYMHDYGPNQSKRAAIKIYREYQRDLSDAALQDNVDNYRRFLSRSPDHTCFIETHWSNPSGYAVCRDNDELKPVLAERTKRKPVRRAAPSRSVPENNFFDALFDDLIETALGLYINKALGIESATSNPSDEDVQKIHDAGHRGMRNRERKERRMNKIYENLEPPCVGC